MRVFETSNLIEYVDSAEDCIAYSVFYWLCMNGSEVRKIEREWPSSFHECVINN